MQFVLSKLFQCMIRLYMQMRDTIKNGQLKKNSRWHDAREIVHVLAALDLLQQGVCEPILLSL